MKVLVAGGTGFLGRHVVERLHARGHEVAVLARGRRAASGGASLIRVDLAQGNVPPDAFAGVEAVVNLVGIKREHGSQTFAGAHVEVVRRLIEVARRAGVTRMVHVSVAGSRPDAVSPYHDTKWRAEEILRESGLAATILRPGVIYGPGDDMLSHLMRMIRTAPVFPIVGRGRSLLQPAHARDVAEAVVAALERPETAGRTYDVVGPERLTLRQVVRTVARGLGLPLVIVPTPLVLLRPVIALWSRRSASALSTPSQLRILERGIVGDPEPAHRDLGVVPRPFTVESVREVAAASESAARAHAGRAAFIVAAGWVLSVLCGLLIASVWYRMATAGGVLLALSLVSVPLPWRALLAPSGTRVAQGLAAAAALYAGGAAVFLALAHVPGASAQVDALYAWRDSVPRALVAPLLALIVAAEELIWRNAVTLPPPSPAPTWRWECPCW
jgi:uncharacterized protein YbjT (DUF2867 family)